MPRYAHPTDDPNYRPSPQPNTIYSGPAVPTAYDEGWQHFTNLTADQIAWFQAQPEWANFLAYVAMSPTTATAATPVAVVNSALQATGQTPLPPVVVNPSPLKV